MVSGAQYIAGTLGVYGVRAVFLVPTILSRTLYELERSTDVARIVTHGEKACVYMADGYARASGQPGVCMAQTVGAANLAAGLRDPYLGCSPVVALTGGLYTRSHGRNHYQEIDDFPLFEPVTKFSSRVPDGTRLPDLLAHAFQVASVGRRGPTHLELAGHSGEIIEKQEFDAEIGAGYPFAGADQRPQADRGAIDAAARMLHAAHRPVIVAGGGVRASAAGAELVALAERLGAPVATSLNAKDIIDGKHPLNVGVSGLYSRACANQVILEADLVFFVGSRTGSQVTLNWEVPPLSATVLQLDIDTTELGHHYTGATVLHCDAKAGLTQLLKALGEEEAPSRTEWVSRAQTLVLRWREQVRELMGSDETPIRPERLCGELNSCLPSDALLVSDTGHSGMWTGGFIDLVHPGQGYIRAAGSLGWGLPAAIGAQVAQPNRHVVLFTGDGGLWYHLAELETAARWNIPVVIVVNNNRSLNQELDIYAEAYGGSLHGRHHELWQFADLDLAAVAETLGVRGLTVRKPAEFSGAMEQALETRGPALINVVSDIEAMAPRGTAERADG